LLAGERAHYALAAGHRDEAEALLSVIENSTAAQSRLLPEQVWDEADIPALELFRGKPTGSACPLVWAHSEYVKLRRSIRDGKVFDQPRQTVKRYLIDKNVRQIFGWRFNNKTRSIPRNKTLRLILLIPGRVHWTVDNWTTLHDTDTRDTGLGIHILDLPTASLPAGSQAKFTFFWPAENRWEGTDYSVTIEG
jgi:glucoamylase